MDRCTSKTSFRLLPKTWNDSNRPILTIWHDIRDVLSKVRRTPNYERPSRDPGPNRNPDPDPNPKRKAPKTRNQNLHRDRIPRDEELGRSQRKQRKRRMVRKPHGNRKRSRNHRNNKGRSTPPRWRFRNPLPFVKGMKHHRRRHRINNSTLPKNLSWPILGRAQVSSWMQRISLALTN